MRFSGKRLLELGTSVGSVDIIKYAKENGAYVIVSDYLPYSQSEAKRHADQTADISTLDVDGLVQLCKEEHINAIMCGVSEVNILSMRAVAEKMHFPVYFTIEQWNTFMDKGNFRKLCCKYNVSVPKMYYIGIADEFGYDVTEYPVIVKPVDNSCNIGVVICKDCKGLREAVEHAANNSASHKVIVEQYIEGDEINCTYVIQNGNCKLVSVGVKYPYISHGGLRALPNAYLYPADCTEEYIFQENENVKNMFLSEGLDNCTIFLQGMYKGGKFYIFEAGLRMEGTGSYRITNAMNGQNFMHFMVDNALGVKTEYDVNKEDVMLNGRKCVTFSQILRGGKIAKICGYDDIRKSAILIDSVQKRHVGDVINDDSTLKQIVFSYVIRGDDLNVAIDFIHKVQQTVKVFDENGDNMLYDEFEVNVLKNGGG